MPNRNMHAASTVVDTCFVAPDTSLSGHVDWYQTGLMSEYYTRSIPLIKRGYTDSAGLQHPRMNGFCTFEVPYFDPGGSIPECTLHYYQSAHNGSADLRVNHRPQSSTGPASPMEPSSGPHGTMSRSSQPMLLRAEMGGTRCS